MQWQSEDRIRQLVRLITHEKNHDKIRVMAGELFELLAAKQRSMKFSGTQQSTATKC